jgi:hypothetical protein
MNGSDTRSLPELLTAVVGDLSDLVRKEGELVRAEINDKLKSAARAGGVLGIGAALMLGALLALLQAIVLGLSRIMPPAWASVIVAVLAALVGFTCIKAAMRMMKPSEMTPDRSARQIRKDVSLVKEQARP